MKDLLTRFELCFQSRELAPEDIPVLRLIMNFMPCDARSKTISGNISTLVFKTIGGDIVTLGDAPLRLQVSVVSGKVLLFATFRPPSQWQKLMPFSKRVASSSFSPGLVADVPHIYCCSGFSMGCASAVAVVQHIHRQLATTPVPRGAGLQVALELKRDALHPANHCEKAMWRLCVGDSNLLKLLAKAVAGLAARKPMAKQLALRQAYEWFDILWDFEKSLSGCFRAKRLGATIDGFDGWLGAGSQRCLDLGG